MPRPPGSVNASGGKWEPTLCPLPLREGISESRPPLRLGEGFPAENADVPPMVHGTLPGDTAAREAIRVEGTLACNDLSG